MRYSDVPAYSQILQRPLAVASNKLTVIVTAAVYRGFELGLYSEELTPPVNLPALGRRQTLYILLRVRRALCFC
jgi:hypothetical protein